MANLFRTAYLKCPSSVRLRPFPSLFFYPGLTSKPFHSFEDFQLEGFINNREAILEEYRNLVATDPQSDYDTEGEAKGSTLHEGSWDWHSYQQRGIRSSFFAQHCPLTTELMETHPLYMRSTPFAYSFFSVLKANSSIEPHYGPANIRLRVHIPLQVPTLDDASATKKEDCCFLTVGNQTISWREGEPVVFDDAFFHETANRHPSQDRILLLFDLWHPDLTSEEKEEMVEMFEYMKSDEFNKQEEG